MRIIGLLLALLLTGCATPVIQPSNSIARDCRHYFTAMDQAVENAGVRDQGPRPIPGFPYLRVDRFLASFADEVEQSPRFAAWVQRLARLDRQARRMEIANLSAAERQRLAAIVPVDKNLISATDYCRSHLLDSELADYTNRDLVRERARVPDDYVMSWRVIGLYPISALFVKGGIAGWHREVEQTYALPLEQLPRQGERMVWAAPSAPRLGSTEVAAILLAGADNPLGIPEPDALQRTALFDTFAPQWSIDTVDENDLPGTPFFASGSAEPQVDTGHPAVYRRLSHTRFGGRILLQLNYIVWFKARPKASSLDIYAGPLDGINFRVTLDNDGKPLLFDTIHNCGCYHKFFPVEPLVRSNAARGFWTERPLVPQVLGKLGEVPVLHVANRTHYVQRIGFTPLASGLTYAWDDYARLRSLPLTDGGHRSLFGEHGIVDVSARPERMLLWPMGIRSPGAMRQWGRHPTAFVGRRHFDDPYLIDRLFTMDKEL